MPVFTVKSVEKIVREGGNRYVAEDAPRGTGKLVLRVRGNLAEWGFQYFSDGKKRLYKIGNAAGDGAVTLAEARERVTPLRRMVADGMDPMVELERREAETRANRKAEAERGSVEQLFRAYVDDMRRRGKSSWTSVERALLVGQYAAVKDLGRSTKAAEIGPHQLRQVLRDAYQRGPSMASHLRAYLSGAFKYGIGSEHDYTRSEQEVSFGLTVNPVASIPPDREARVAGDRVLTAAEIKSAWLDMQFYGVTSMVHDAVRLILAVGGQRVREVVEAPVQEFDLDARIWTIPPERTKNNREHRVPLTERAVQIIEERIEAGRGHPFLFPHGRGGDRPMDFPSINQAVRKLCDGTGIPRWTPRDIRRTARTMLADVGEPDHRLDYHLNHGRSVGVGQKHYDRSARLSDKTITMNKWDGLLAKMFGEKTGKVLPLRSGAD